MLDRPPQEKEGLSWLWVIICALVILATIPLARALQRWVSDTLGDQAFTVLVAVLLAAGGIWALATLYRSQRAGASAYVWLGLVAVIYIVLIWHLSAQAAEVLHLLEYGLLGLLAYRALSHRLADGGIYVAATLIGSIVGILDEAIQWATPERVWELRDIAINVISTGLAQVAVAGGLRPRLIRGWPGRRSVRLLLRLGLAFWLLIALSLLNTPQRIAWYAQRIPGLGFLYDNQTMMVEYGYRYEDPAIGVFRSRLSPGALRQADQSRATAAAEALDAHQEDELYDDFLKRHTPTGDPFLHEARVHLFRRDRYIGLAREAPEGSPQRREFASIANRETEIMRRYYPQTYGRSRYRLSPEDRAFLDANRLPEMAYDSRVSRTLITLVDERFFLLLLGGSLLGLIALRLYYRRQRP